MAETSRSQVTITLGRSGQVVKRAGPVLDSGISDSVPAVGSKRSVRDRLGSSVDAVQLDNKRLRGDNNRWSLKASNSIDDFHLSKDDLRFKIMKRTQSNGQQSTMDLRDILSRRARPSTTNQSMHDNMHEPKDGRQRVPQITTDPRDDRRRMPEQRNDRQRVPEPRNDRHHMPEPRNERPRMPQSREGRQGMSEPLEVRQRVPEPTNGSMTGQFASTRTLEAPSQMDMLRNSYSPWTLDHIRRRSPERVLNSSRGLSPPRRPLMRAHDDPRTVAYAGRDVGEISRPVTTSFLTKPPMSAGPTKPVGPLGVPPLLVQRSRYLVEEHVTVEGFLHSLGLDKYVISFKVEEVDMAALSQMGDHDLKELGIPMGPRKKILLALAAQSRRQTR